VSRAISKAPASTGSNATPPLTAPAAVALPFSARRLQLRIIWRCGKSSSHWQAAGASLVQRESEAGGPLLVHSDMASIRVAMMARVCTLRFDYTFEENLARRKGVGTMAR
jgi:hypothetical protein